MKPYFSDDEHRIILRESILRWKGSPYWNYGRTKHGVDCAGLIAEILKEIHVLLRCDDRYYAKDWYLHTQEQILLDTLLANKKNLARLGLVEIDNASLDGDIVLISTHAGLYNHAGLYLQDGLFFHSMERLGAILDNFSRWERKPMKIFRVMEE